MTNQTVDIFFPTYRNADVFAYCLRSCLDQYHRDIRVFVYDNSLAEGCREIEEVIRNFNDNRVYYLPNSANIGHILNYQQIIKNMASSNYAMCLSADIGLTKSGLLTLLSIRQDHGALIAYGGGEVFPYCDFQSILSRDKNCFDSEINLESYSPLINECKSKILVHSGIALVDEYYSDLNLFGEYNSFSFFGALINGKVLTDIGASHMRFRYHGFEQYLSMHLALRCHLVARTNITCLRGIVGSPRIGGTQRPLNFFTRLEPIISAQKFIDDFEMILAAESTGMEKYFIAQICKCNYFLKHYSGFEEQVLRIISYNQAMLNHIK